MQELENLREESLRTKYGCLSKVTNCQNSVIQIVICHGLCGE